MEQEDITVRFVKQHFYGKKEKQPPFTIFHQWLKRQSIEQLKFNFKKSRSTIIRIIHWYLQRPPKSRSVKNLNCHLIVDETWFKKDNCLLLYFDHNKNKVQRFNYTFRENAKEIEIDLKILKINHVVAESITSDGGTGIKKAVEGQV